MTVTTLDLQPLPDETGRNDDARARYLARVHTLGPDVPPDAVLLDWFQEQPIAGEFWKFLDLSQIAWSLKDIPTALIPGAEAFFGSKTKFNSMVKFGLTAKPWITNRMRRDGTWPVPPVLLQTKGMTFRLNPHVSLSTPLHLAEGYHRVACFHAIKAGSGKLAETHQFWVGSQKP